MKVMPVVRRSSWAFFLLSALYVLCAGPDAQGAAGGGSTTGSSSESSKAEGGAPQSPPSSSSQSQNNKVEISVVAYDAMDKVGTRVAQEVLGKVPDTDSILIADDASFEALQAFQVFNVQASALTQAFKRLAARASAGEHDKGGQGERGGTTSAAASGLPQAAILQSYLTALSTVKASATVTSTSVQPGTLALLASVLRGLQSRNVIIGRTPLVDIKEGQDLIVSTMNDVYAAQEAARLACCKTMETSKGAAAKSLTAVQQDYESLAAAIPTLVAMIQSNSSGAGTGLLTGALIESRINASNAGVVHILRLECNAIGGSTRQSSPFLVSIFYTPMPAYSGGAIVTYLLTRASGAFEGGATFRFMHDFSKVSAKSDPKEGELWNNTSQ